jgi:hypothetical protein
MGMAMKGISEAMKIFTYIAVALILVSVAINPLNASIQDAKKNTVRLAANEIAGVINIMKASPSVNLTYSRLEISASCKTVEVSNKFVRLNFENENYVSELIQSPVAVSAAKIDCKKLYVTIEKKGKTITVS